MAGRSFQGRVANQGVHHVPSMANMGVLNKSWGICGFTSTMYAVYKHTAKQARSSIIDVSDPKVMLAEILRYLDLLAKAQEQSTLDAIENFTKSFGGIFAGFTMTKYMESLRNGPPDLTNAAFSIAMPPAAVVDYLKRGWGFSTAAEVPVTTAGTEFILGVRRADTSTPHGGLRHYIYERHNKFYSWGNRFGSLTDAMAGGAPPPYQAICCKIAL